MAEVSRLVAVDPRTVWPNEAADFTPWLRDNADALADALGLDIDVRGVSLEESFPSLADPAAGRSRC